MERSGAPGQAQDYLRVALRARLPAGRRPGKKLNTGTEQHGEVYMHRFASMLPSGQSSHPSNSLDL
jgi:hypothetical protein